MRNKSNRVLKNYISTSLCTLLACAFILCGCPCKKQDAAQKTADAANTPAQAGAQRAETLPKRAIVAANEAESKANLAVLREAVNCAYTADNKYPDKLEEVAPDCIRAIPAELVSGSSEISPVFTGKGGWFYDGNGRVTVNLEGTDNKGVPYKNW